MYKPTIVTVTVLMISLSAAATAQNDSLVKVGRQPCQLSIPPPPMPGQDSSGEGFCEVSFEPPAFSSKPTVTVSLTHKNDNSAIRISLGRPEVTSQDKFKLWVIGTFSDVGPSGTQKVIEVSWVATGIAFLHTTVNPSYLVLSVIYAPPGANGGKGPSSVAYQTGMTTGTTTVATRSFLDGNQVSVAVSGAGEKNKIETGVSYEFSKSTTDTESLEIRHSFTKGVTYPGGGDGLDHNRDQVMLWLNPTVGLALAPTAVSWGLIGNPVDRRILPLYVGWLNGSEPIDPDVGKVLKEFGISESEYCEILKHDPLAPGRPRCPQQPGSSPSLPRYVPLKEPPFVYQRPLRKDDPPNVFTINLSDSSLSTMETTAQDEYTVKLSTSAEAAISKVVDLKLTAAKTWKWTNKFSRSSSTGTSTSATATIGGPSFTWGGAGGEHFIQVYVDSIYRTFAFGFVRNKPIALAGTVVTANGMLTPERIEVILVEDDRKYPTFTIAGEKHQTFTDANGKFTFFGTMSGAARVQAAGVTKVVQLPQPDIKLQLK
jgi:hypothetical protein